MCIRDRTIAKEYSSKYKDKIIYLEKENGGLSDARNYAIPVSYTHLDVYKRQT